MLTPETRPHMCGPSGEALVCQLPFLPLPHLPEPPRYPARRLPRSAHRILPPPGPDPGGPLTPSHFKDDKLDAQSGRRLAHRCMVSQEGKRRCVSTLGKTPAFSQRAWKHGFRPRNGSLPSMSASPQHWTARCDQRPDAPSLSAIRVALQGQLEAWEGSSVQLATSMEVVPFFLYPHPHPHSGTPDAGRKALVHCQEQQRTSLLGTLGQASGSGPRKAPGSRQG